jgi:hypothetical protein
MLEPAHANVFYTSTPIFKVNHPVHVLTDSGVIVVACLPEEKVIALIT